MWKNSLKSKIANHFTFKNDKVNVIKKSIVKFDEKSLFKFEEADDLIEPSYYVETIAIPQDFEDKYDI
jgi:hypothetical protein